MTKDLRVADNFRRVQQARWLAATPPKIQQAALAPTREIKFGLLKDRVSVPVDFDAPLPSEVLADFGGG